VRHYHYENTQFPQWLTGRTDELGVRIGTYAYDSSGRLASTAGPSGANALVLNYNNLPARTTVTDYSSGTAVVSEYTWERAAGVIRPVAISAPCSQCGSTSARTAYNPTGEVARRVDHDGRITFYTYDTKGRETERATFPAAYNSATTRPALSLAERVVSTKWHSTWNLPTQVAEPQKVTAYTYGTGGRLTGES
jgi:YD repeat-containing protein